MGKSRSALRVLLIQVRDHRPAALQEAECFLRRCRLEADQLAIHNIVAEAQVPQPLLDAADVLMIGGAGSHSVTVEYPFSAPLVEVLRSWIDTDRPFFGSCWGHQFLVQALGGRVEEDKSRAELGTYWVEATEEGAADPLLAELPRRFAVQLGHNDQVIELPSTFETLARSELCPHQLVRLRDRPVYGSQFHSEINADDFRKRVRMYEEYYVSGGDAELEALDRRILDSPEADTLLDRFLRLYT